MLKQLYWFVAPRWSGLHFHLTSQRSLVGSRRRHESLWGCFRKGNLWKNLLNKTCVAAGCGDPLLNKEQLKEALCSFIGLTYFGTVFGKCDKGLSHEALGPRCCQYR